MLGTLPLDDAGRRTTVSLLDVSGHGVGASLLSVTIGTMLRSRSPPSAERARPRRTPARIRSRLRAYGSGGCLSFRSGGCLSFPSPPLSPGGTLQGMPQPGGDDVGRVEDLSPYAASGPPRTPATRVTGLTDRRRRDSVTRR
jgi:hypothetical protein